MYCLFTIQTLIFARRIGLTGLRKLANFLLFTFRLTLFLTFLLNFLQLWLHILLAKHRKSNITRAQRPVQALITWI